MLCTSSVLGAHLFLDSEAAARDLAPRATERERWEAMHEGLAREFAHEAADSALEPGAPVVQLARLLALLREGAVLGLSLSAPRFADPGQAASPSRGDTAGRAVPALFSPLASSPSLLASRITVQGEYASLDGLFAFLSRLREAAIVLSEIDLDEHHVRLGLTVLARSAP